MESTSSRREEHDWWRTKSFPNQIPKVRKVEMNEEESDFEICGKSDGKPIHVNIDKGLAVDRPTPALLPNRSEDDKIIDSGEMVDGDGNVSLRRSNRIIKPPKRSGSVP